MVACWVVKRLQLFTQCSSDCKLCSLALWPSNEFLLKHVATKLCFENTSSNPSQSLFVFQIPSCTLQLSAKLLFCFLLTTNRISSAMHLHSASSVPLNSAWGMTTWSFSPIFQYKLFPQKNAYSSWMLNMLLQVVRMLLAGAWSDRTLLAVYFH